MAVEITMPQLSDTMNEGRILTWLKKEGDKVSRGDALAEVATDKADLEIESFHEGVLMKIEAPEGTTVRVGSIIAVIGDAAEGAGAKGAAKQPQPPKSAAPTPPPPVVTPPPAKIDAPLHVNGHHEVGDRVKVSPLAKNIAASHGVDLAAVRGTGDGGRIVRRDVEQVIGGKVDVAAVVTGTTSPTVFGKEVQARKEQPLPEFEQPRVPQPAAKPEAPRFEGTTAATEPLSKMRTTIANRMVESKTTIPHFYMTAKVVVNDLARMKDTLKPLPQYEGLTYNHLILKAVGMALRAVPRVNATFVNSSLVQPQDCNVGIVTAIPDGLLIPVLKRADQLSLSDIVTESKALVQRARAGRPKADDLSGGTFSVSNMGIFPVESFSAIISPGQGGILAVSSINEEPIVSGGEIKAAQVMRVTLSVDHRIIDGIVAGEFLKEFKRIVEDPILLLA